MSNKQVRAPMPGDPLPRPRGWMVGAAGLALVMAYVAWASVREASIPNGYLARHGWNVAVDGPWRFPHEQVRTWLSVMAVEGGLAMWVLAARWHVSLAMRSACLSAGAALLCLCMSPLLMHSSAPFPQHFWWLELAFLWMTVFAAGAGLASWGQRLLRRRRAA